jgi:hypothetical protein
MEAAMTELIEIALLAILPATVAVVLLVLRWEAEDRRIGR